MASERMSDYSYNENKKNYADNMVNFEAKLLSMSKRYAIRQ